MKIILTDNVKNLGRTGDVVSVADGYARNFLIPKRLAVVADEKNVRQIKHQKTILEHKLKKQIDELREHAKKIGKVSITIARKVGENQKLFGSVTNQDIHAALIAEGVEVDRKAIQLSEPIKALGSFKVMIKLSPEVDAEIKCKVVEEKADVAATH